MPAGLDGAACRGRDARVPSAASALLKSQTRPARGQLAIAASCAAVNGGLMILQYALLARVIGAVIFQGAGLDDAWPLLWPMLPLILARAVMAWRGELAAAAAAARVKQALRLRLYDHIRALGPVRLGAERTGDLAAVLVDGVDAIEPYVARFLPAMMTAALVPAAILAVVLPGDALSALVLAVTAPLIPLFMILIGRGAERLNQRQWARLARMSAHFLEVLQNLTVLKLFNVSRREAETIARMSEEYRLATMSVLRVAFLSALALEFFATVSIALVAVLIGFRLLAGEMDFERGFFILLLAPEFYLPLRGLGAQYHARMEAIAAAGRMAELLRLPVPQSGAEGGPIALEDAHLTYPDGRVALSGVSLRLEPGRVTALVGPSGAGKSSVVNLLLGFVAPSAGRVRSAGGAVAWVPQRPYLFRGTIADNIRLGNPDAGDDAVVAAARLTGADAFIAPLGYDHPIGEHGGGLSGGQIRLLALTRAALLDAPLLVLDEPTASLDRASEWQIGAALARLARGRAVLVVAHRLETVEAADVIIVMERGRVVERGDHAALLRQDGLYAALLRAGLTEATA